MLAHYFEHLFPIQDPVVVFAIVLVLMLGAPILMSRFNLPGMIGLLLAGAVLGPNGLGILARDQSFILLGAVGLLYIMFTAALEVDMAAFKRYRVQGVVFGVLTFTLPQGLGTLMAYYLLGFDWPGAILVGSTLASHTLLAYPIVSRLGLSKNKAVVTTIGGTMVTDTAALLVLAVIAGSARGEVNEAFWWRLGISLTVFVAAILVGLPRIGRWFFRRMAKDGPGEFVFVLTSVFICAALSEVAGVEPIVGAFLAGIALNRLIPHNGALMNRIVFTGEAIFIPFFLISVGMMLDSRVLFGGLRTWVVAGGMIGTVLVAKYLAAEGARLVFGFSRSEGRVVFGLSIAQAAATLAAVMVGHGIGLFDETIVNGSIVVILVTCILAPWLVDRHGKKVATDAEKSRAEETEDQQRILVPIMDAASAKSPVELAMLLRGQGSSPLYPVFVAEDGDDVAERVSAGERTLAQVANIASSADVPTHSLTRVDTDIAVAIRRARKELRITDVVAGWDGRVSSEDRIFGSVLDEVAADDAITLCVLRQAHAVNTTTRILLVVPPRAERDLCFETGVSTVKRLARQLGAPIHAMVLHTDEKAIIKRIKNVRPSCKIVSKPLEQWDALMQALADRVEADDLVVLLGCREGSPAFDANWRTLPRRVAARFPEVNQLVVFGAEPKVSASAPHSEVVEGKEDLVARDRIVLGLEDLSLEAIVARVCAHARAQWPNERPPEEGSYKAIIDSARELGPGVILLQHRDKHLKEPSLWLGVTRSGVETSAWEWKGHLFFVLFAPENDVFDSEDLLAQVEQFAFDRQSVDAVRFATSLQQAQSALRGDLSIPDLIPRSSKLPAE